MKFTATDTDENYPALHMLSENGQWECGVRTMLFGYRVAANPVGNCAYSIDYCCANEQLWIDLILSMVVMALEPLPETLTDLEARRLFPVQDTKPIKLDPTCFEQLKQLAFHSQAIK